MSAALKTIHIHAWDFWLARASVTLIVVLQLLMVNDLTVGPKWLAPTVEPELLVPLSIATAWTQANARAAAEDRHWRRIARERRVIRASALMTTALITLINFGALIELVDNPLHGGGQDADDARVGDVAARASGRTSGECSRAATVQTRLEPEG